MSSEQSPAAAMSTALAHQITTLMQPSLAASKKIHAVLEAQDALSQRIDQITARLTDAAAKSSALSSSGTVAPIATLDSYLAKLRGCRQRVDALSKSLVSTRQRLTRVHAHLSAAQKVQERSAQKLEQQVESALASSEAAALVKPDEIAPPEESSAPVQTGPPVTEEPADSTSNATDDQ